MDASISRDLLFGNPERTFARLSPDGRRIAFLAPDDGVLNVFVGPVDDVAAARPVTNDRHRGVRELTWSAGSDRILYLQDRDGDEDWHLRSVDVDSREDLDLTPGAGLSARLLGTSRHRPGLVCVALNDREPQLHDVVEIDVATGQSRRTFENPGFLQVIVDSRFVPRLGLAMNADGAVVAHRLDVDGMPVLMTIPAADNATTGPLGYSDDGATLYLLDSTDRDTNELVAIDVATGARATVASDPRADLDSVWTDPRSGHVDAVVHAFDERVVVPLTDAVRQDLERLAAANRGEIVLTSRSDDDTRWLVAWVRDDGPTHYAAYDRASGAITPLFVSNTGLLSVPLTRRRPVVLKARDGLPLVSYLSLPRWLDNNGRPTSPLPMVLLVHGGPWARDSAGYEPYHQLLANRGYAVLSVNFRGSTGFGKHFTNAANHEWAGAMHDDLLDAVAWAVAEGVADRAKIAIMGGSYGGYAALVGLTFTPTVFACGVDIVGPSNLLTLLSTIPAYWKPAKAQFTTRVGDDETEEGRAALWAKSPLSRVDAIVRPLLIGQGANDPRVKVAESDQIVDAMRSRGIPVEYVLFPDEGHGFARPANRIAFVGLTERFLARHLGGRAEDAAGALSASTAQYSGANP